MLSPEVKKPPVESTSWSFTDTKPGIARYGVKHTHVVTIGNISEKMKVEHGTGLLAERFSIKIGDQIIDWCIGTYPNCHPKDNESAGHIGVGLVKITETEVPIDANMVFSVVNKRGFKVKSKTFDRIKYDGQFEMKMMGYMLYRFISHTDLRGNPDLTPDDTLTIMCELTIKEGGVLLVGSESKGSQLVPVEEMKNEEESTRN